MCTLDSMDEAILQDRVVARDSISRPRLGDFVQFPTGEIERFSHDWGDSFQTSPTNYDSSFYLSGNGLASFSGGLNPAIPMGSLERTDEVCSGRFWFFHHDVPGGGRGVYFLIPCRLYKTTAEYKGFLGKETCSQAAKVKRQVQAFGGY